MLICIWLDFALAGLVPGPYVMMRAPMPHHALLCHSGVGIVGLRWCLFPYRCTSDLSLCASVVSLDNLVRHCCCVRFPPFVPGVDHVAVGATVPEVVEFEYLDVLL